MSGTSHRTRPRSAKSSMPIRQEKACDRVMELSCPLSSADVLPAMLLSLLHIACLRLFVCLLAGLGFASRAASDVCLKSLASQPPLTRIRLRCFSALSCSCECLWKITRLGLQCCSACHCSCDYLQAVVVAEPEACSHLQGFCLSDCGSLFARGVKQKSATCVKLVPTAATAIATATATAFATATAIANATATATTAEFYNRNPT